MTDPTRSTFENEHIQVEAIIAPGCNAELHIQTKAQASQAARVAAVKEVVKAVEIPGFRKGKAPKDVVEKQYAKSIDKEFQNILIRNALDEAIKLSQIRPFNNESDIRLTKFEPSEEGAFKIAFAFECFPSLPAIDMNALHLTQEGAKEATEEEILQRIEELQLYHAEWQEILDRGAEEEDFVVLDVDLLEEGGEIPIHRSNRFKMAKGKMPEWVIRTVKGLKKGESKTAFSEKEEGEDEAAFTPKEFRFTIQELQKPILPPLDDALSKKAGVDTVELLKEAIAKRVQQEHKQKAQNQNRRAMQKLLCSTHSFEIPASRWERLKEECEALAKENADPNTPKDAIDAYAKHLLDDAELTFRLSYLVPKLYHEQNLAAPTAAEVQQRATEKMIQRFINNPGAEKLDPDVLIRVAENELFHERALDFLLDAVKKA